MGAVQLRRGGLIDHHLLHVHHVIERVGVSVWDWLFLASGVAMMLIGWALVRGDGRGVSETSAIRTQIKPR